MTWRFSLRSMLLLICVCAFAFVIMTIPPNPSRRLKHDLGIPSTRAVTILSDRVVDVDGTDARQVVAVEEISKTEYRLFAARKADTDTSWMYPGEISVFNVDGTEDWLRPEIMLDHFPRDMDVKQFEEDAARH